MHKEEEKNIIETVLIKNEKDEIVIRFKFSNGIKNLNLQSNDSNEIKKVFLECSKEIRKNPITFNLSIDNSIDEKKDSLFIDVYNEYISQLNAELLTLETDDDLKTVREFNN